MPTLRRVDADVIELSQRSQHFPIGCLPSAKRNSLEATISLSKSISYHQFGYHGETFSE